MTDPAATVGAVRREKRLRTAAEAPRERTVRPVDPARLTGPQRAALAALAAAVDTGRHGLPGDRWASPRDVARLLWPDSPAWTKRTRRYGTGHNGAMGGTMPMKAATMLHRLAAAGLASDRGGEVSEWRITDAGRRVLENP